MATKITVNHGYSIDIGPIKSSEKGFHVTKKLYSDLEKRARRSRNQAPPECISIKKEKDATKGLEVLYNFKDNDGNECLKGKKFADLKSLELKPEFIPESNTCIKIDKELCLLYNGTFFWEFDLLKNKCEHIKSRCSNSETWEKGIFDNFCYLARQLNLRLKTICDMHSSIIEEVCFSELEQEYENFFNRYDTNLKLFPETPEKNISFNGSYPANCEVQNFGPVDCNDYNQENMKEQYGNQYFGYYFLTKRNLEGLKIGFYIKGRTYNNYLLSLHYFNRCYNQINQAINLCANDKSLYFKLDVDGTTNVMLPFNSKSGGNIYFPVFLITKEYDDEGELKNTSDSGEKEKEENGTENVATRPSPSSSSSSSEIEKIDGDDEVEHREEGDNDGDFNENVPITNYDDDNDDDNNSVVGSGGDGGDGGDIVDGDDNDDKNENSEVAEGFTFPDGDLERKEEEEERVNGITVGVGEKDYDISEEIQKTNRHALLLYPNSTYTNLGIYSRKNFSQLLKRIDLIKKTRCLENKYSDTRWDLELFYKFKQYLGKEFILQKPIVDYELICCYLAFISTNKENNICLYREGTNEAKGYEIFHKELSKREKLLETYTKVEEKVEIQQENKKRNNSTKSKTTNRRQRERGGEEGEEERQHQQELEVEEGDIEVNEDVEQILRAGHGDNGGKDRLEEVYAAAKEKINILSHLVEQLKTESKSINPSFDSNVASLSFVNLILANRFCVLYNIVKNPKRFLNLMENRGYIFTGNLSSSFDQKQRNDKYLEYCEELKTFCERNLNKNNNNNFAMKKVCGLCMNTFEKQLYKKQKKISDINEFEFDLYDHPLAYCHRSKYYSNDLFAQMANMFPSLKFCYEEKSANITRKHFCVPFNLSMLLQLTADKNWYMRIFECKEHPEEYQLLTLEYNNSIKNLVKGFNYNIFYNDMLMLSDVSLYIGFTKRVEEEEEDDYEEEEEDEDDYEEEDDNEEEEGGGNEAEKTEENSGGFNRDEIKWEFKKAGKWKVPSTTESNYIEGHYETKPLKFKTHKDLRDIAEAKLNGRVITKLIDGLKWYSLQEVPKIAFRYETLISIHKDESDNYGGYYFEDKYFQIMCAILFEEKLLSPLSLNQMIVNVGRYYDSTEKYFEAVGDFKAIGFNNNERVPKLLTIAKSMDISLEYHRIYNDVDNLEYIEEMGESRRWHSLLPKNFENVNVTLSDDEKRSIKEKKFLMEELDKFYLKMQKQFHPLIFNEIDWQEQIFFLCEKAANTDIFGFLTLSGTIVIKYLRLRGIFKKLKDKPEEGFAKSSLFQNLYDKFKNFKSKDENALREFYDNDSFLGKNISGRRKEKSNASTSSSSPSTSSSKRAAAASSSDSASRSEKRTEYQFSCFINFSIYWNWAFNYVKMEHLATLVALKKILEQNFNSLLQVWDFVIKYSDIDIFSEEKADNDLEALINVFKAKVFGFIYCSKERAVAFKRSLDMDSFSHPKINADWIRFVRNHTSMIFGAQIAKRKFLHLLFIKLCVEYYQKYNARDCSLHLSSVIMNEITPSSVFKINDDDDDDDDGGKDRNGEKDEEDDYEEDPNNTFKKNDNTLWNNEDNECRIIDKVVNRIENLAKRLKITPKFDCNNFLQKLREDMLKHDKRKKERAVEKEVDRQEFNNRQKQLRGVDGSIHYYKSPPKFFKMPITKEIKEKMEIVMWNEFIEDLMKFILAQIECSSSGGNNNNDINTETSSSSSSSSSFPSSFNKDISIFKILNKWNDLYDNVENGEGGNDDNVDCIFNFTLPTPSSEMTIVDNYISNELRKAKEITSPLAPPPPAAAMVTTAQEAAALETFKNNYHININDGGGDEKKLYVGADDITKINGGEEEEEEYSKIYRVRELFIEKEKSAIESLSSGDTNATSSQFLLKTSRGEGGGGSGSSCNIKVDENFGNGLMSDKFINMYGRRTNVDNGTDKTVSVYAVFDDDEEQSAFLVPSFYLSTLGPIEIVEYFKAITFFDIRYIIDFLNQKFVTVLGQDIFTSPSQIGFGTLRETKNIDAKSVISANERNRRYPSLKCSVFDTNKKFVSYDLNEENVNRRIPDCNDIKERKHLHGVYNSVVKNLQSLSWRLEMKSKTVYLYRSDDNNNKKGVGKIGGGGGVVTKHSGNYQEKTLVLENSHNVFKRYPNYLQPGVGAKKISRIRCEIGGYGLESNNVAAYNSNNSINSHFGSVEVNQNYLKGEFFYTEKINFHRLDILAQPMDKFKIMNEIVNTVSWQDTLSRKKLEREEARKKIYDIGKNHGLDSDVEDDGVDGDSDDNYSVNEEFYDDFGNLMKDSEEEEEDGVVRSWYEKKKLKEKRKQQRQKKSSPENKILLQYFYHTHKEQFLEGLARDKKKILSLLEEGEYGEEEKEEENETADDDAAADGVATGAAGENNNNNNKNDIECRRKKQQQRQRRQRRLRHQLYENTKYEFDIGIRTYKKVSNYTFSRTLAKLFNHHHSKQIAGPKKKLFITKNPEFTSTGGSTLISHRPNVVEADGTFLICGHENELFFNISHVISNEISVEKLVLIHEISTNFDEILAILYSLLNANSVLQGLSVFVFLFSNNKISKGEMDEEELMRTIYFVIKELAEDVDRSSSSSSGGDLSPSSIIIKRAFKLIEKNVMYLWILRHLMVFIGYGNTLSSMDNEFMHHLMYTINQAAHNMLEKTITLLVGIKGNEGKSNFMTLAKRALFGYAFSNCNLGVFDTKSLSSSSASPNLGFLKKTIGAIVDEASTVKESGHDMMSHFTNYLMENVLDGNNNNSSNNNNNNRRLLLALRSNENGGRGGKSKKRIRKELNSFEFSSKLLCSSRSVSWNENNSHFLNVPPTELIKYHYFTQSSILCNTNKILQAWHTKPFSPIIESRRGKIKEQSVELPPHIQDTVTFSNNILYSNGEKLESFIDKETYLGIIKIDDDRRREKPKAAAAAAAKETIARRDSTGHSTEDGEDESEDDDAGDSEDPIEAGAVAAKNNSSKCNKDGGGGGSSSNSQIERRWYEFHEKSIERGGILDFVVGRPRNGRKKKDYFAHRSFTNEHFGDSFYEIVECDNGDNSNYELIRIMIFSSDKASSATKIDFNLSNNRKRFHSEETEEEEEITTPRALKRFRKIEEGKNIIKNVDDEGIKLKGKGKGKGRRYHRSLKRKLKEKDDDDDESDVSSDDDNGDNDDVVSSNRKKMKYNNTPPRRHFVKESEINPPILLTSNRCPATLSYNFCGGGGGSVYRNISETPDGGGSGVFNKKTGIYDGSKNESSWKSNKERTRFIKPDLLKTVSTPGQEMVTRNIYQSPSMLKAKCQLFLLANSFDVDFPVDDAMLKRLLVFRLNTVNESSARTNKFLEFVEDLGDYLQFLNHKRGIEGDLKELTERLNGKLSSLVVTLSSNDDNNDGSDDDASSSKKKSHGYYLSKIAQFISENKIFPRLQLNEKNICKSLNSFFSIYSILMFKRCDKELPMFKQAIQMKSLRTCIDGNFSTFNVDVQKIMSTFAFFPLYKNKFGFPRNCQRLKVIDKTILNKLYIEGEYYEEKEFHEAYIIPFDMEVMDLRRGGNITTRSVPQLIKETLEQIGTPHFYDLQCICNHIHMIIDYVCYCSDEIRCALSALREEEYEGGKEIPASVISFMQTSHKISMPLCIYEKMMQDIQNDNLFSIYEPPFKYNKKKGRQDENDDNDDDSATTTTTAAEGEDNSSDCDDEGDDSDDDSSDDEDYDESGKKNIEVYPLMISRKIIPLSLNNEKYHKNLIKCVFKAFKIFRLDLCCDICKESAFNL
ncbi:UNVERIFIED_CONTAM: hypothetical protein RMT77_018319 [Armadillidium vulgare]